MRSQPDGTLVAFTTTAVANLFPLLGVALLGWDADTLAFVYAVEVVFAVCFSGQKTSCARQPPDDEPGRGQSTPGDRQHAEHDAGLLHRDLSDALGRDGPVLPFAEVLPSGRDDV